MARNLQSASEGMLEAIHSMQQAFIKENGRLLTDDEAIKMVDDIRKELREKGDIGNEN